MRKAGLVAMLLWTLALPTRAGEAEAAQFEREGKLREAYDAYQLALKAEPGYTAKALELAGKLIAVHIKIAEQQEKEGSLQKAFQNYLAILRIVPADFTRSGELRMKIIALALKLNPPPEVPEEAKKRVVFAMTALEEQTASGNENAVKEFAKATQIAPWWPLAYYNLGLLQEKLDNLKAAVENLQFYLAAAPDASDAAAVKTQLFKLEYKLERLAETAAQKSESLPENRIPARYRDMYVVDSTLVDKQPVLRVQAQPVYPDSMRSKGIVGEVLVDYLVDNQGAVQNAYAARSSHREFEAAAVLAVSKWIYRPGRKDSRNVVTHMQVSIAFKP